MNSCYLKMNMNYIKCLIILLPIILNSCATIVKDDSQPVAFSSEPQGADVSLNNITAGTTPTTLMVKRKRGKTMITYQKAGFKTETFPLDKSVSAMAFGNIIFGGFIGAGVDYATGKGSNYQDSVHVKLIPDNGSSPPTRSSSSNVKQQPPIQTNNSSNNISDTKLQEGRRKLLRLYTQGEITETEYREMMQGLN